MQSFPAGAAERWSELAAEASLGCQLCIANKMDAAGESGADAAFYEHAVAWSLDHGFEPVECVATQPAVTAQERDKTSVARVLEALQSNMWSNLERHAAPGAAGGSAAAGLMVGAGIASRGAGAGAGSGAPSGAEALAARGGFLMSADEDSGDEGAGGDDEGVGAGGSRGAGGGAADFDLAEALEGLDDDDIDGDDDAARALRAAVTGTSLADSGAPSSGDAGSGRGAAPSTSATDAAAGAGAASSAPSLAAAAPSSGVGGAAKPATSAAAKAGTTKTDEAALARDIDADFTKMVEEVRADTSWRACDFKHGWMRDPGNATFEANENSNRSDAGCSTIASHSLPTKRRRPVQAVMSFPFGELLAIHQQRKLSYLRAELVCAHT